MHHLFFRPVATCHKEEASRLDHLQDFAGVEFAGTMLGAGGGGGGFGGEGDCVEGAFVED